MKYIRLVTTNYDLTLSRPVATSSKPHRKIPLFNDQVMADGSLRRYVIGYKKNPILTLQGVTSAEFNTLRSIWESGNTITFYLDSTGSSEGTFLWIGAFELEETLYVGGSMGRYSGDIELRET